MLRRDVAAEALGERHEKDIVLWVMPIGRIVRHLEPSTLRLSFERC